MKHIDLFSGIGGFALAAQWTGFETEVFCEKDKFCQRVLKKHWPEVPIIPEIRDFDGTKWKGATILTGGFPCQPFSVAGKQRGKEDDRYIWPEMFRIIKEAKPTWVIAENVTGIIRLALEQVLADLEGIGYDFPRDVRGVPIVPVIPACSLNAPHRRNRIWILAHSCNGEYRGWRESIRKKEKIQTGHREAVCSRGISRANENASNSCSTGRPRVKGSGKIDRCYRGEEIFTNTSSKGLEGKKQSKYSSSQLYWEENWIEVATHFCRVDDGVSNRVDRLKSLGNAIVPQVAEVIMKGIKDIENK